MDQGKIMELCGLDPSLRALAGLYCAEHPSEAETARWFAGVEFEALRPEAACMAAVMSAANDYAGVPQALAPRLRGIIKHVHTLNAGMTAGLCTLGKQWAQAGIPSLLLRDTAVRLGYPHCPPRYMWQTEAGVSREDYPKAVQIASDAGFAVEQTPYSAIARCGNTQCVIIHKGMENIRNTSAVTLGGAPFLMPGGDELLVSLAETVFSILCRGAMGAKLLPWLMDLHHVASHSDWAAAAAAAARRGTASQVRLVLELYRQLVPGVVAADVLDRFAAESKTASLADVVLTCRETPPGRHELRRLWLSARIRTADTPLAAPVVFLRNLFRAAAKKLTPGS